MDTVFQLTVFPPHSEPLGLAGNTSEGLCPNDSPFGKTFFSLRARTPNLGYVVLGAPGNVCKHLSIPGYLEKAGKGA
jgi:hypothetical protein